MGSFDCQGCGVEVQYRGPGRPRFCDACRPRRYDEVQRCVHGVPSRAYCEPCSWHRAFWARRQPPRTSGTRRNVGPAQRRRELEAQLAQVRADREVEVAAVRALDVEPDDRKKRLALVREQLRAEVADLGAELRDS
jgi:hypothetical protein